VWKAPVFEHQQEGIWGWCWEVVKLPLPLKGFLIECAKKRCAILACGGGPSPWVEKQYGHVHIRGMGLGMEIVGHKKLQGLK